MIDYKASNLGNVVSGMSTGSTVFHVNMTSGVALSSIALHSALRSPVQAFRSAYFLAEFIILAMSLLSSMILFAEAPGAPSLLLLVPMFVLLFLPLIGRGTHSPAENWDELALPNGRSRADTPLTHSPQSLRSLPADYPLFPRILAKCETCGVSLMDIGVGSFVFSQGVVSAIPTIKDISYLQAPILPKLKSVSRKMIPIIVLGILRVVLVKDTEYPEHVTEYGVHRNFFLALALLPIIEVLLHPMILQGLLSLLDITHYSCYVSIHILGLSSGTAILPPSPSNAKIITELLLYSVVCWTLLAFVRLGFEVSRRMANISYVLWVAAYNTSFILGYILLDMVIRDPTDPSGEWLLIEEKGPKSSAPALLEAINRNGLMLFLLAMCSLCAYSMGMCVFAWLCRRKQLWKM
ncbi:GWT1-domain-containing protein [Suillus plorans]|uniref:GPI-anchored wall transfer protein n=1 Tax=Suillus plorans TaxID=116603 RepID=A0A9P7DTM3_9AGAM|nr:GWT1-domain-containing protein [Suillus plorans]KAG1802678.1 GWT1-domain-containing protein [Suillus plorans]